MYQRFGKDALVPEHKARGVCQNLTHGVPCLEGRQNQHLYNRIRSILLLKDRFHARPSRLDARSSVLPKLAFASMYLSNIHRMVPV